MSIFFTWQKNSNHGDMNKKWKILVVLASLLLAAFCSAQNGQTELLAGVKLNSAYEQRIDLSSFSAVQTDEILDIQNDEIDYIDLAIETPLLFSDVERVTLFVKPQKNAPIAGYLTLPQKVSVIKCYKGFAKIKLPKNEAAWLHLRNIENKKFKKNYQEQLIKVKKYIYQQQQRTALPVIKKEKTESLPDSLARITSIDTESTDSSDDFVTQNTVEVITNINNENVTTSVFLQEKLKGAENENNL